MDCIKKDEFRLLELLNSFCDELASIKFDQKKIYVLKLNKENITECKEISLFYADDVLDSIFIYKVIRNNGEKTYILQDENDSSLKKKFLACEIVNILVSLYWTTIKATCHIDGNFEEFVISINSKVCSYN